MENSKLNYKEILNKSWQSNLQIEEQNLLSCDPLKFIIDNANIDKNQLDSTDFPFQLYLLERSLRRRKYSLQDFKSTKKGIFLKEKEKKRIFNQIESLFSDDNNQIIENCLLNEYDYLLNSLQHKKYFFVELELQYILPGSQQHYNNLNPQLIELVSDNIVNLDNIPLAQAIIAPIKKNNYRIVDGYHRIKAFKLSRQNQVKVFLAEDFNN
jgi:hypothetical protein